MKKGFMAAMIAALTLALATPVMADPMDEYLALAQARQEQIAQMQAEAEASRQQALAQAQEAMAQAEAQRQEALAQAEAERQAAAAQAQEEIAQRLAAFEAQKAALIDARDSYLADFFGAADEFYIESEAARAEFIEALRNYEAALDVYAAECAKVGYYIVWDWRTTVCGANYRVPITVVYTNEAGIAAAWEHVLVCQQTMFEKAAAYNVAANRYYNWVNR